MTYPQPTYLKVKIKSLAAEATIIRREEMKALNNGRWCSGVTAKRNAKAITKARQDLIDEANQTGIPHKVEKVAPANNGFLASFAPAHYEAYHGLRMHRVKIVREEARFAQLAYGFLRGRTYAQLEGSSRREGPKYWALVNNTKRMIDLVKRFGNVILTHEGVLDWIAGK